MNMYWLVLYFVLSIVMGGCSSHQLAGSHELPGWKPNGKKIVAYTYKEYEKEGIKLCPFGFDVDGRVPAFKEGRENIRYIRCRLMK